MLPILFSSVFRQLYRCDRYFELDFVSQYVTYYTAESMASQSASKKVGSFDLEGAVIKAEDRGGGGGNRLLLYFSLCTMNFSTLSLAV